MSDKRMVVVRVVSHEADGQIVVGFLRSRGIEAAISEDDAGNQIPSLEETQGVQIFVPAADERRARELLDERDAAAGSRSADDEDR